MHFDTLSPPTASAERVHFGHLWARVACIVTCAQSACRDQWSHPSTGGGYSGRSALQLPSLSLSLSVMAPQLFQVGTRQAPAGSLARRRVVLRPLLHVRQELACRAGRAVGMPDCGQAATQPAVAAELATARGQQKSATTGGPLLDSIIIINHSSPLKVMTTRSSPCFPFTWSTVQKKSMAAGRRARRAGGQTVSCVVRDQVAAQSEPISQSGQARGKQEGAFDVTKGAPSCTTH